ncbi:MAG: hypothetical protein SGI73_19865 [Chloroflexota bacterium]|nr:hypothetical protein [Chloroflexota bacterium]
MNPIETAILKTVLYADVFNFPLNPRELHHFLIASDPISFEQVTHTLSTSARLAAVVERIDDYIVCVGRHDLIAIRAERERASEALWNTAVHYGVWLGRLPFVRMVALTGALSMRNASADDDDLDYVLVTATGRVWLARGFAVLLVKLARRRGVIVCPNYVLAETALAQEKRDLFIAHEVAQMIPLYGLPLHAEMRAANQWVLDHLPNTSAPFYPIDDARIGFGWRTLKRAAEWLLGGVFGNTLESWEQQRKIRRFARELETPNHAAKLDEQQVKGHFNDHGHPVMRRYQERLQHHGLSENSFDARESPLPLAGD